jgi:hypothetical protein
MDTRRFVDYYEDYHNKHKLGYIEKGVMFTAAAAGIYFVYFKAGWWNFGKTIKWADSESIRANPLDTKKLINDFNKPASITTAVDTKEIVSVFYTDSDYKGKALNLNTGIYDLSAEGGQSAYIQSFYDKIMSLKVHPLHKVRIYNCIGLQGAFKDFYWTKENNGQYNSKDLGTFINTTRSIEIVPNDKDFIPFSKLYKGIDFGGVVMLVRQGDYPNRDFFAGFGGSRSPISNISFSSARIHPKHRIKIYDANNYQGNNKDLTNATSYNTLNEFNNNILSLKVVLI